MTSRREAADWYAELMQAFANPFNFLLTILAVVSGLTGDKEAMVVIGLMVVFSTGLRFMQESRSNKAALTLRALVRTSTAVERDGGDSAPDSMPVTRRREIPMSELVPGDIVYLSAGDMIPADCRVIAAKDLFISQAALTGESLPVEKSDRAPRRGDGVRARELPTICFMGTSVVSGTATARGRRDRRSRPSSEPGQGARRPSRRHGFDVGVQTGQLAADPLHAGHGPGRVSASTASPRATGARPCCSASPSRSA